MAISEQEVRKVARLARLAPTDAQVRRFTEQLGAVLEYMERLQEVDVEGVEPMAHAVEVRNCFREDAARDGQGVQATLANAPAAEPPFFAVPRVFEE
jgi:aspartyl-tRNA(Asn)/glutamyl-tRNA(Gln) amidotransferase subunit C